MGKVTRILCGLLAVLCLFGIRAPAQAAGEPAAYLLLEAASGEVLAAHNESQPLHGAGITKLMTGLLVCEAIRAGEVREEDVVQVSAAAAAQGGTSAFLDAGESHVVTELLKAVAVGSANDAAYALAEHLAGSEAAFVERMNVRAAALGAEATFADCTGLSPRSVATAQGFAKIAAELSKYPLYLEYSSCWMYSFIHNSGRETEIVNSNTLVRDGLCDGLATGSSDAAGYCMAATAKSGQARFVCVVLGAADAKARAALASQQISEAVAGYAVKRVAQQDAKYRTLSLEGADKPTIDVYPCRDLVLLYKKGEEGAVSVKVELETPELPLKPGQVVGRLIAATPEGERTVALEVREEAQAYGYLQCLQHILRIWTQGL